MRNATKRSANNGSARLVFSRRFIQRRFPEPTLVPLEMQTEQLKQSTLKDPEEILNMVSHPTLDRREFLALSAIDAGAVSLHVTGNAAQGYGVTVLYRGQAIARHHEGGEFSAIFQNSEHSLEDRVDDWRAVNWSGDDTRINLSGEMQLGHLRTTVYVDVKYEVLAANVVKKTIQFCQADMFSLLYQLDRKSTRLNSSHANISYAVFCL